MAGDGFSCSLWSLNNKDGEGQLSIVLFGKLVRDRRCRCNHQGYDLVIALGHNIPPGPWKELGEIIPKLYN